MVYDVATIGGGAAGLFAAIRIKQTRPEFSVAVFEALDRVGKKLIVTGNGRCNITNKNADFSRFHGSSSEFITSVLSAFSVKDAAQFFKKIGVEIVFEDDGRAYPLSYQASSVVDALRLACDELGVNTICNCKVCDIENGKIKTSQGEFLAKNIIVTGGLMSGGAKVGSDGSIISLLKKKGIKTAPLKPALVQLKTNTDVCKSLKGIKINCNASLVKGGQTLRTEYGEVLFCDYGLSGPPILQISRDAEAKTVVSLDLLPQFSKKELVNILNQRVCDLSMRTCENFLTGFLNKRVGQTILKLCGISLSLPVCKLNPSYINNIATTIKNFEFEVVSNTGFANSQVTAGGILQTELDYNLQLKKLKNVYAAGEIINVDGDCGGFNLQWAWSSAAVCVNGVCK